MRYNRRTVIFLFPVLAFTILYFSAKHLQEKELESLGMHRAKEPSELTKCPGSKLSKKLEIRIGKENGPSQEPPKSFEGRTLYLKSGPAIGNTDIESIEDKNGPFNGLRIKINLNDGGKIKFADLFKDTQESDAVLFVNGEIKSAPRIKGPFGTDEILFLVNKSSDPQGPLVGMSAAELCF